MPENEASVVYCPAECTITIEHKLTTPLLEMEPADASLVIGAAAAVWAVAWCFRQLYMFILNMSKVSQDD